MKKFLFLVCMIFLCVGCKVFQPITQIYGYYPPVPYATIVTNIPDNCKYIGTIKLVPHELAHIRGRNKENLLSMLKIEAAKAGANYVYIIQLKEKPIDFIWDIFDAGYTVKAELYRQ